MSDVAQILGAAAGGASGAVGGGGGAGAGAGDSAASAAGGRGGSRAKRRPAPRAGLRKEVFDLVGQAGLPSIVPTRKPRLTFKGKRSGRGGATKWAWKPFSNSARRDRLRLCHWVRASAEFDDYPFARFAKQSEIVRYTDDEYRSHLSSPPPPADADAATAAAAAAARWSKEETDHLFDLCRRFDLRWAVIADRYEQSPSRPIEELKERFYTVTAKVLALRCANERMAQTVNNSGLKAFANFRYNAKYERKRRAQLEGYFARSQTQQNEEIMLKAELKRLDSAIATATRRRGKKYAPAEEAGSGDEAWLDGFPPRAEVAPTPGTSLRSTQLVEPPSAVGLSKRMQEKLELVLAELNVTARPMPTPKVVEQYNELRLEALAMINLTKYVSKRREELAGLKVRRQHLANPHARRAAAPGGDNMATKRRAEDGRRGREKRSRR